MFAQVELYPDSASTFAAREDALFWFLTALTGVLTGLIAFLVIYFAIKYRRRSEAECPEPVVGSLKLETIWSVIPAVAGLLIFGWGASIYFDMYRIPSNAMQIDVVGRQWMWKVQHPDGQREINELHIPVGQPVQLRMISEDVIHSFYIPDFRVKQDVLPGRYTRMWFQATKPGRYHLFCAEYCGTGHSRMIGTVIVLPPDEYQRWLELNAEGSPALRGRKLFLQLKCIACHNAEQTYAPLLEEKYGRPVRLDNGQTVDRDDDYLRESILNPRAKVVAGYKPIMPTYKGQVTEEDILHLIAFIKALGRNQTPPRVEATEPPIQEVDPEGAPKKP